MEREPARPPAPGSETAAALGDSGGGPVGAPPGPAGQAHRSGFVSLVGRPNVGKSTLLNRLLGQKLAIVSPKPQTTRNRIRGIRTLPHAQVVYVDTPGLHPPRSKLGRFMADTAAQALEEVDAVVLIADATRGIGAGDDDALGALMAVRAPIFLALNKVDRVADKERLLPLLSAWGRRRAFEALVPISARNGSGVDRLERLVLEALPAGPPLYPGDTLTDQPETFFVAETIREKLFFATRHEVPYACAVRVEEVTDRGPDGPLYVRGVVFVEQPSQRKIVVGEGGAGLRRIGQAARHDLETFFGVRVYLDLWVRVRKDWRKSDRALRELGYLLTS